MMVVFKPNGLVVVVAKPALTLIRTPIKPTILISSSSPSSTGTSTDLDSSDASTLEDNDQQARKLRTTP
jgi:hypothetical protein